MKYEEWDRDRKAPKGLNHQATCMLADWTWDREERQRQYNRDLKYWKGQTEEAEARVKELEKRVHLLDE